MSNLGEQKCPCCGGAVQFDVGTQKLKCPFCDTEFDIEAVQQAEEFRENSIEDSINWGVTPQQWGAEETEGMSVYVCNSCGGEIVVDSTTAASKCPYCDNPVVMKGNFAGDLRPDLVIPFKIDKKAAKESLIKHIASKKFVPKVFKDENHIDEIKGVYVPHWLFSCDANTYVNYHAETVRTWKDSNYKYTETSHFDVSRAGSISFDNVPVDGSSKMPDDLMESVEPFDITQGVDFNTAYLAGYLADKYDVDAQQSINRANERIKRSTEESFASTVKGYTSVIPEGSNIQLNNGKAKYALYPVWILNTTWKDKNYLFAMNGQTGKFVGDLPMDKGLFKKWLFSIAGAVSAVTFLITFLGWLL